MRDDLALFCAFTFLILGAMLVYEGMSSNEKSQSASVLSGAALVSFGLAAMLLALQSWWRRRKIRRRYRDG